MSTKPAVGINLAVRVVFLVLVAFLAFAIGGLLFVFFAPIVGWYVWRLLDKTAELEKRITELEGHKKPGQS